jgi:hypothetical protein
LAFAEDAAREAGVRALHLGVVPGNVAALELYRRVGFHEHDSKFLSKWIARDSSKPQGGTGIEVRGLRGGPFCGEIIRVPAVTGG